MNNQLTVMLGFSWAACSKYEPPVLPDVDPQRVTGCSFTQDAYTPVSIYDCNPVFTSTEEEWMESLGSVGFYAKQVLGHPFYQLWYTSVAEGFGNYALGYAVSDDGVTWYSHPENPLLGVDPTAWDKDSMSSQVIVWDPIEAEYVMAYQGFTLGDEQSNSGIWGLGVATSIDGVSWEKSAANPVINFSEMSTENGDAISPCWPLTISVDSRGSFRGYIAANSTADLLMGETICNIYSIDGLNADTWVINDTAPVLSGSEFYDNRGVTSASVVELNGTQYMFYIGFSDWLQNQGYQTAINTSLNIATSTDGGNTWIKDPNNPLPITMNFSQTGTASGVAAQVIGDRIHLWVTDTYDGEQAIGYFLYEPISQEAESTEE